jgi:hypothetical protein
MEKTVYICTIILSVTVLLCFFLYAFSHRFEAFPRLGAYDKIYIYDKWSNDLIIFNHKGDKLNP